MSRRKQLNPRPLGEYTRTKTQEPTSQHQSEIHKKTPQKTFNEHMVTSDEDEESTHLMIDEPHIRANGARISSDHFPLTYTYSSSLTCPIPTTSAGHSSCSPQSSLSNGDASPMTGSSETLSTMKGKKHHKVPVKRKSSGKILPTGKDGQNGYVCPQCDTLVPTQHELTTHLRSHNGVNNSRSEHQCHQCWKILSSSSSLDRHMLTHSGEKPFSCRICKQSFTTNGNMHRHMRTHEKKNDQRRAALLKPKNKSSSSFSSKMDLFDGSIIESKNSLRLSENVEMVSQSVLKANWSSSTLTNDNKKSASDSQGDLNPKPSILPFQNEGHDLSQKPVLKNTLPSLPHSPTESSPKNSLHSSPRSSPLNSITTVEFSSSKFPLICIAEGSKNVHRPKTGQQEYGCEDCQLYFPCKKALDLHLQTHYTDKRTSCSVCDLTFSSPENYQQHCHCYHTEDANEYQAVFMNSLNLISNQNSSKMAELSSCVNGIDKGSLAKQCHLSEDTQPGSVSPQLQIDKYCEEDIKSKEGQLNNYSITQDESNNTNSHISIGTEKAFNGSAKKKSSYTCTYCNADFINTRAAKSHERSHLGLSPYQCKSCSYSSPDKSTLIRHMRTHNGERPYQCKLCSYAFTTKANCERHVKKKHNIFKKEELETKVGYNKDTKEAQDDSFSSPDTVCKYCNKDFKYFRRLKHHLRGHRSSEEKPFKCKQCEMGFSTKANCVRHIQNKHTEIDHVNIENYVQMQETMFTSFMGHTGPPRCTSAPPPAHSPAVRFSDDSTEDAKPLDLRSSRNLSQSSSPSVNGGSFTCPEEQDNNEPIDLSIKRTKKAIRKIVRTPDPNTQCPKCDQEFGSELERQYHIKISHDQATKSGDRESWQKQSASQHVSHDPAVSLHHNCPSPLTKKIKLELNLQKDKSPNIDCNSDDLASVSQILNTTGANSFEAYFANHQEDDTLLLSGQINGYSSSPSEYGNDGPQIKDEPRELDSEYISVAQEETILNNSSDAKDMARQEPEMDSIQKSHKKKRNSYADSPHKLKCPHCPRHFPWASSLNRHILTHTGEKPFECPKCHVIFSTKSNRERHLTRKHGVNMLDPAARQTMDRPFKCHLCTFSSFATKENLLRHYRDRHPEDPLPDGVCDGIEKSSSSGSSPQQQKTKFHSGSSNITMELKSSVSAEKNMSDEHAQIPSKLTERENIFRDDVGRKNEELEINNNLLHWTQKPTDLQENLLTSKSHLCYMCGCKLSTQQLLQQHFEVHSKDLPFKCHLCDTSFHERSKCLKHMEKEHRAEWSILTNKNKITNMGQFSDDVDHRCQEYVKRLSDCVEQNSHMTDDYFNKKVYCSFCMKRFGSTQDLCHHMHSHNVCQLTNKEAIILSSVSETDPLLVRTLPADFSAKTKKTETEDILPTMLGMDEASIDFLLDSAVAGVHLTSSYIP